MTESVKKLLIVWHSRTGAAKQMAQAAADGARKIAAELTETEAINTDTVAFELKLIAANQVKPHDLLTADGYIFCAPENLASLSGAMKDFFDSNYYQVLGQLNGRPYAAIITAGSDGQGALKQLERICLGWRLEKVAPTMIVPMHAQTPEKILAPKIVPEQWLAKGYELGGTLAALIL